MEQLYIFYFYLIKIFEGPAQWRVFPTRILWWFPQDQIQVKHSWQEYDIDGVHTCYSIRKYAILVGLFINDAKFDHLVRVECAYLAIGEVSFSVMQT